MLPRISWEQLHDLTRSPKLLGSNPPDIDASPTVIKAKRKWVGEQLVRLEELNLVQRTERPGRRPKLVVLRDDGSGDPFDDPTGSGANTYLTILGTTISSGRMAIWGAPEFSASLAATAAERYDPVTRANNDPTGMGQWFRPLGWFADVDRHYGPDARMRLPFSVPTLERGIRSLNKDGLILRHRVTRSPSSGQRLQGPRTLYTTASTSLRSKLL